MPFLIYASLPLFVQFYQMYNKAVLKFNFLLKFLASTDCAIKSRNCLKINQDQKWRELES